MQKTLCGITAFVILFTAACNALFPTKIGDILKNPRNYADKEVTVSGEVASVFSLVVVKYFLITDGTGEIAVVTEKTLPNKGDRIRLKGVVKEAFSLGDTSLIVIMESAGDPKN